MRGTPQAGWPIRVIGVIDVRAGRAVHARGGDRAGYLPVTEARGRRIDGDPVALARLYVEQLGVGELYVADLDAIEGGTAHMQSELLSEIARVRVPVWVDAGVSTVDAARAVVATGAVLVVVGLETLPNFAVLERICTGVGAARVAFSLDLRNGVPVVMPNVAPDATSPIDYATIAARAGVQRVILLDLARVGSGARFDQDLMRSTRAALPHVELFVGGGVKDANDLTELERAGCDGVLVATALLTGTLDV